ncbi:hypothetical protein HN51_036616 [Arachis hypogaea]
MRKVTEELDSIHFSMKRASKLTKQLCRQIATDKCIMMLLLVIIIGVIAIVIVKHYAYYMVGLNLIKKTFDIVSLGFQLRSFVSLKLAMNKIKPLMIKKATSAPKRDPNIDEDIEATPRKRRAAATT